MQQLKHFNIGNLWVLRLRIHFYIHYKKMLDEEQRRQRQREANKRYYERNRDIVIEKVRLNQLRKKVQQLQAQAFKQPEEAG